MLQAGRAHGLQPGPHDVEIRSNVSVRMRDGVHLATDLYLPRTSDGRLARRPCLLERTPYGKATTAASDVTETQLQPFSKPELAVWFASHGYAMAMQDCRGRYSSEGLFTKYVNEGEDGVDTIAWLAEQPWCDGRVLTQGLSYCAHVQTALGSFAPSALFAQFIDSGGFSNAYQGGIRQGGAFELKQATWALKHALLSSATLADPVRLNALQAQDMHSWFRRMPWRRGDSPVSAAPEYEDYLFDQWERGDFSDYWKQRALCGERYHDQYADVPMVHMSSWYDPYVRTAIDNYLGLSRRKTGPVHLIMGPWTHGKRSLSHAGDVDFGPDATLDQAFGMSYFELRRKWYDHLLDPEKENPLARGSVSIFLMGGGSGGRDDHGRLQHGGRWVHADGWPLPGTLERDFYLHADGSLLAHPPSLPAASRSFAYDPSHPVPTMGGTVTSADSVMLPGAYDQREHPRFFGADGSGRDLGQRPDVVSFRTPPLQEAVEVVGEISARLFLSSDCPDTDITIKLIDEYPPSEAYPDGFAMNLTDGILRVRYRDSWERPTLLVPGQVVEITVTAFATANLFAKGHRIRLDISSSNYPHFDLNPNTGGPQAGWSEHRVARNTLHLDREHPSRLLLPIRASTTENQTARLGQ